MKELGVRFQAPLVLNNSAKKVHRGFKSGKQKKARRGKFRVAAQIRRNPCFRAFVFLISLQTFILFLFGIFVGDDFPQAMSSSRAQTILLIRNYYANRIPQQNTEIDKISPGIVLDDDSRSQTKKTKDTSGDDDLHEMEDHIANQIEERLNQVQQAGQHENGNSNDKESAGQPPIDNYYTRQAQYQQDRNEDNPFQFLIVGGSDGSGTRAFVSALGKLGVPMIVDDRGTLDIHGKPLFDKQGWPPLVQLVLNHTHSANYNVRDLPEDVSVIITEELTKLKEDLIKRGARYDNKELNKIKRKLNHYPNNHHIPTQHLRKPTNGFERHHRNLLEDTIPTERLNKTNLVQYGWKAPVSMLLLPFLREVFGPIKFLHVIRDGRDVALSTNQSPVKKFYNSYYKYPGEQQEDMAKLNNDTATNIRAMQLWNDWNIQVLEYERANVNKGFDYLVMRTEDLLDPERKFLSLQQLAHFVGSRNSMEELCCQSQQAAVDMGQSNANTGEGGRRHFPADRNQIYERLFEKTEKSSFSNWFRGNSEPDEDVAAQVHGVLESAGSHGGSEPNLRSHGVMGADPVLGFAHGTHNIGDWQSNVYFDAEEGRHRNWHHGLMDVGDMVSDARNRRMVDLRRREERYKGLSQRIAEKKREHGELQNEKSNQHGHKLHDDAIHSVEKTPDIEEHRRRLLSSFSKLQIRHNPYRKKKPATAHEQTPPSTVAAHDNGNQQRKEPVGGKPGTSWSLGTTIGQALGLSFTRQKSSPSTTGGSESDRTVLEKFQSTPLEDIIGVAQEKMKTTGLFQPRHEKKKKRANVKARYGKWVAFLEDKPELSQQFHELGSGSLEAFGYEPPARFLDTSGIDENFQCDTSVVCEAVDERKAYRDRLKNVAF